MQYQIFLWAITISFKFKDPDSKITEIIVIPIETSYEIICAAERNAPKKAYLELLDHPDIIIPYTVNEDNAKNIKILTRTSANTEWFENGIILQFNKLKIKVNNGAIIKIILFDKTGIIVSLTINFTASAIGCNKPKKPTKLGPLLF
jgi:hypothetical protein